RMFVGLRGPVLRGWAIILEIEFENIGTNRLSLKHNASKRHPYKKYFLNLHGLGIRELCIDGDDLLILAGPTMELNSNMALFRWIDGTKSKEEVITPDRVQYLFDIPHADGFDKAEGL